MNTSAPLNMPRLVGGCALTAALIAAGHWFPPSEPHKSYGKRRRVIAYVYGVSAILAGLAVADERAAGKAAAVATVAGAATLAVYLGDEHLNTWLFGGLQR